MNPPVLPYDQKMARQQIIGEFFKCPVCFKERLSTWEGERVLKCLSCGSIWRRKVKYKGKASAIKDSERKKQSEKTS